MNRPRRIIFNLSLRAMLRLGALASIGAVLVCASRVSLPVAANDAHRREWRSFGGDEGGARFSPLTQINQANVSRLARAWTYHTGETPDRRPAGAQKLAFQCTPLVVDGVLYLSTPTNRVIALDAETGKELWAYDPKITVRERGDLLRSRGVAYWEGEAARGQANKRIIFGTNDGRLITLDAATGKPCADFGAHGTVDLQRGVDAERYPTIRFGMTSPPAIYRHLVIVGARVPDAYAQGPSGDVRAFDARTGREAWRFHTVPRPGAFGHETWAGASWQDRTGVNVWAPMSVDTARGLVFLPIGSASYDFHGGDRKGQNLFANSLVALDAATGKRVWHYQLVHHDVWDRDLPAQPNLITVRRDGREVAAVAVVTKTGFVFVFDRQTGRPLFPIEERPVPQSTVPGEATWPTQPVPTMPPALIRHAITRDEITNITPESRKYCLSLFDSLEVGKEVYAPLGLKPTLLFPGTFGGANWSGASFDPTSGLLYVNVNELGMVGHVAPNNAARTGYPARFWDKNNWPCQQPPWGTLNAVDMNSGQIKWRVPLGVVEELAARGLPATGTPNLGGSLVTAGGLVFIGASNDRRFRAFDAATGKVLWEAKLEGSGHAAPVTYEGRRNRRQYVVIAAGGGGYMSRQTTDALAAYALPR